MKLNWDSIRLWSWRSLQLVALLAILAAGSYWYFAAIPVVEHEVKSGELVAEVMGTGTLEARVKSTISPRISGRLQEVLVDMGDWVTAGSSYETRRCGFEAAGRNGATSVEVARAALDRLQADQVQAVAVLEQATADYKRDLPLVPTAISQQDMDKATVAWKTSQAGVARAEAALIEGRKQLIAAERDVTYRKALLDDTAIVAPFDGLIVERDATPAILPFQGGANLTLVSTKELWVTAWVDETEMSRLHPNQPARVAFRSESEKSYQGKVSRLGREADRETREFVVDVRVITLPENWAVGQRRSLH